MSLLYYTKKSLDDWTLPKPINLVFLKCQGFPRRNIEILGKQNLLFPSRVKYLLQTILTKINYTENEIEKDEGRKKKRMNV